MSLRESIGDAVTLTHSHSSHSATFFFLPLSGEIQWLWLQFFANRPHLWLGSPESTKVTTQPLSLLQAISLRLLLCPFFGSLLLLRLRSPVPMSHLFKSLTRKSSVLQRLMTGIGYNLVLFSFWLLRNQWKTKESRFLLNFGCRVLFCIWFKIWVFFW